MAKSKFAMYLGDQGCLSLRVGEARGLVTFIAFNDLDGFKLSTTSSESFHQHSKPLPGYPVKVGCEACLQYSLAIGATPEVLDYLGQILTISSEDYKMATTKRAKKKAPAKKALAKKAPAKKAPAKKAPAKKAARGSASGYTSAAQAFQGLIMEGKLTDDQIFAAVQEQFGLDDKRRSYVGWYRNNLRKKGENPPEAK